MRTREPPPPPGDRPAARQTVDGSPAGRRWPRVRPPFSLRCTLPGPSRTRPSHPHSPLGKAHHFRGLGRAAGITSGGRLGPRLRRTAPACRCGRATETRPGRPAGGQECEAAHWPRGSWTVLPGAGRRGRGRAETGPLRLPSTCSGSRALPAVRPPVVVPRSALRAQVPSPAPPSHS